jgi:hypothetical protein
MINDLNLLVMEKQVYVTLWSKSGYSNNSQWVIERTHNAEYIAATVGLRYFDEFVQINGRLYKIMPEGVNPNVDLLATA